MNFIKKKLKGHKKDDEEEEYEKAVAEQSLHQGDQRVKNTEEWQFFNQLSMKVQDTVQKTQTTLSKLKDTRQDSKDENDFYDIGDENAIPNYGTDIGATFGAGRVGKVPPRPPPPPAGGDQAWFTADESELSRNVSYRAPGETHPQPDMHMFTDNSAFNRLNTKPGSSPVRPPPPKSSTDAFQGSTTAFSQQFDIGSGNQPQADATLSMSLLDEFGFQPVISTAPPTKAGGLQDLLFLDVKEETDPFDTSFVNVSDIAPTTTRSIANSSSKPAESSSNPFADLSKPAAVGNYNRKSSNEVQNTKKNITNPFFSAAAEEDTSKELNGSLWSSHNPFSSSQPPPITQASDDLLGLEFFAADNKGFDDTYTKPEVSLLDAFGDENMSAPEPVLNPSVSYKPDSSDLLFNHDIADRFSQAWASDVTSDVIKVFPDPVVEPSMESPEMESGIQWETQPPVSQMDTEISNGVEENIAEARKSSIDERRASIGSESKASIGSESKASIGSESKASIGSERKASIGSDSKASISSERKSSIGSEGKASIGSERKASIGSERKASIGAERKISIGEEQQSSIREERKSSINGRQNSIQEDRRNFVRERQDSILEVRRSSIKERQNSIHDERRSSIKERQYSIHEERRSSIKERQDSIHEDRRSSIRERQDSILEGRKSSIQQERKSSIHKQQEFGNGESMGYYKSEISSETSNQESFQDNPARQEYLEEARYEATQENFEQEDKYFEDAANTYKELSPGHKEVSVEVEKKAEFGVSSGAPVDGISQPNLGSQVGAANGQVGADDSFSFSYKEPVKQPDYDFDAFAAKFESAWDKPGNDTYDPFSGGSSKAPMLRKIKEGKMGFDSMDEFDPFKAPRQHAPPPPRPPPIKKDVSKDSFDEYDMETDFSIVIKPKVRDANEPTTLSMEPPKLLPPPPKTPTKVFDLNSLRFNPFDKDSISGTDQASQGFERSTEPEVEEEPIPALGEAGAIRKTDSLESPLTPLFDEDTSVPLEEFPRPFPHEGYDMVLRQPNKKKLTGNRFWKKIYLKITENNVLQLFNKNDDKLPFQELPLQACYSLSEVSSQQYDQYGKIFTVKVQYKFYRERVGVRAGQVSKVIQGQVTSMGDVARLGLPLQHSPQTSQLLKLGTHSYPDIKYFIQAVEDCLFRMALHRDRVLTYKSEEIQVIAQDVFYVEQSKTGHVDKQLARVAIFFLAFITGMPSVEVGLNDINRQGKEVVGRYDIIPVVTEEWIRLEAVEFHSCVIQEEFHKTRTIKFQPPDACLFELLRFRIRPPKNRELPLQVRVFMTVTSSRVEIRSDILVPGYSSRKQGQIPCENIQIRFPIPECWIYLFRTEKHFRYGSKKSTARRPGKIKGLERIIGAAQNLDPSLIEVSAGQAKYEHVFHAVVWRIPRLPKEGQGAYTQQLFLLRTELTAFDQIPESFDQHVDVEFTMPATYVSHTTVRSISVSNPDPPEKYVRYVSKHEYKVEIQFKSPDEMEGLISSPNPSPSPSNNAPTATPIHESTEDEKDEDSD